MTLNVNIVVLGTDTDDISIDDETFKEIMKQIEEAKKNRKNRQTKN
jgi:hypothetical protein